MSPDNGLQGCNASASRGGGRDGEKEAGESKRERKGKREALKKLKAIFISLTGEGKLFQKETLLKWQK